VLQAKDIGEIYLHPSRVRQEWPEGVAGADCTRPRLSGTGVPDASVDSARDVVDSLELSKVGLAEGSRSLRRDDVSF
jgi:hypothetical protein